LLSLAYTLRPVTVGDVVSITLSKALWQHYIGSWPQDGHNDEGGALRYRHTASVQPGPPPPAPPLQVCVLRLTAVRVGGRLN
jgi:hypothetical protein